MKVYIAAPWPYRDKAITVMRMLETKKVHVTSRWLKAEHKAVSELTIDEQAAFAREDLDDVLEADLLLALNPEGWEDKGTGGRHVELGYAIAHGKPVILAGERTNVFHYLPSIKRIDDSEDIVKHVQKALS